MLSLLLLAATNGAVRSLGGDPFWLSPWHLGGKLHALGQFALHLPRHPFGDCGSSPEPLLRSAARRHGVPYGFVATIARVESGMRSHRVSSAGAMGMMQLMPATARRFSVNDPFDPQQNIEGGVRFIAWLWQRYQGDRAKVAAAYNAGPASVPLRGALKDLPEETRQYVRNVAVLAR